MNEELVFVSLMIGVVLMILGMYGYSMLMHPSCRIKDGVKFWKNICVGAMVLGTTLILVGIFADDKVSLFHS